MRQKPGNLASAAGIEFLVEYRLNVWFRLWLGMENLREQKMEEKVEKGVNKLVFVFL